MMSKRFKSIVVLLSCVAMTVSPNVMASPQVAVAQTPRDVALHEGALHEGGVLVGQMLNAQGVAVAGTPIAVQAAGKEIARVQTDKDGKFRIAGLKGGVHLVTAAGQQSVYRLWAPHTAPPAAQQGLMLVSSTDVVRGQCGCGTTVGCGTPVRGYGAGGRGYGAAGVGGIGNWMANHPILTAGAIATAIAVPLALDDDDPPATP